MPDMIRFMMDIASRRPPSGRISAARSSSATRRARRRSPPTYSIASPGSTGSKTTSAASRPMSGADTGKSKQCHRSTRFAARSTMRCAACRPRRRWQQRPPVAPTAGQPHPATRRKAWRRPTHNPPSPPPDVRRRHRKEQAMPQIDALRGAIDDALRRLSPKSAMAKALAYGRKRWDALTRYTEEGMAEIDNNIAERAIRSIAIGRKNWLFAGSKAGGERAAAIYSVIETAKLNGVEPQAYIADVIEKIASGWPASRWDELMPWNWQPEQQQIAQAA